MDLLCKGTSCGNCENYIGIGDYNTRICSLHIMPIAKSIEYAYKELAKDNYDPQVAIIHLRNYKEVKDADLDDLAWAIYQDGCAHKNDVLGFLEHLEKWLKENTTYPYQSDRK